MSRWLLIGDETALPAIGRRIETAQPGAHVTAVVAITGPETFVWIAAETFVAGAVRNHVTDALNHPKEWLRASGYWIKGRANAHEKLE